VRTKKRLASYTLRMADPSVSAGSDALRAGRWADARTAFESALTVGEDPEARFGLASALWWLGDSRTGVREAARAYALFREGGDVPGAIQCAVWSSFIYHGDFANYAAANGWVGRAETLLQGLDEGSLHGWVRLARASILIDLPAAEDLTELALRLARDDGDADLELTALAQLGRIRVGMGEIGGGFALIDEAMAAALAGERTTLDTVANTGCDMLTACELASDLERAEQWCQVVDEFVEQIGCPYLYAECRIVYGGVLVAKGRWADAEQQLTTCIRADQGISPGLLARARARLAGLRIRQGLLEEAERLLKIVEPDAESDTETTLCLAALQLARADASSASRTLQRCRRHLAGYRRHLGTTLAMLVEASLLSGDRAAAARAAGELTELAGEARSAHLDALAADACGRMWAASGDDEAAVADLRTALAAWSRLHQPFESARTRSVLGRLLAESGDQDAPDCLRRALADFQELGAVLEADRVACQLRGLGVPVRPATLRSGVLSQREVQVLRLVAAGLSNPEIAARMHVSRKTVAHHVSHLLAKLNLRNRAEVAAYAAADLGTGHLPRTPG
jgi:ATP/maltotriose-dependent transcriptional regulator MalT